MSPKTRTCPDCGRKNRPYEIEACSGCGYRFLWRRYFGRKAYNQVVVYEREHGGPLQIMWWNRGGVPHRESLTNLDGVPVFDRDQAELVGADLSARIAKKKRAQRTNLRSITGMPDRHTVGELFERRARDLAAEWKGRRKHLQAERRFRRFWSQRLGKGADVTEVTPSVAWTELVAGAKEANWSPKTQNHYRDWLVGVYAYAQVQLRWITADQNLEALRRLDVPIDNDDLEYSKQETVALLDRTEDVDLRCAVCADLSYVGSRRLTAIRTLDIGCYRTDTRIVPLPGDASEVVEFGVVTFPAETDKAKKKGEVYLYGRAKDRIERLIATPAAQASGTLFPKGALASRAAPPEPVTEKFLRRWLREAEALADVDQVKGRSYHAFNRAFASTHNDPLAASGQAGKRRDTMERIYEGARPDDKAALAIYLDQLLKGA